MIAKKHRPELLPWLRLAAFLGTIRHLLMRLIPNLAKKWLQRYGYFLDLIENNDDPEIINIILSHNSVKKD